MDTARDSNGRKLKRLYSVKKTSDMHATTTITLEIRANVINSPVQEISLRPLSIKYNLFVCALHHATQNLFLVRSRLVHELSSDHTHKSASAGIINSTSVMHNITPKNSTVTHHTLHTNTDGQHTHNIELRRETRMPRVTTTWIWSSASCKQFKR